MYIYILQATVALMAPKAYANFLSYLTGWLTILAWEATAIETSYLIATTLQGIVVLARPTYIPMSWHTVLIMWAAVLFANTINLFEGLILILHE